MPNGFRGGSFGLGGSFRGTNLVAQRSADGEFTVIESTVTGSCICWSAFTKRCAWSGTAVEFPIEFTGILEDTASRSGSMSESESDVEVSGLDATFITPGTVGLGGKEASPTPTDTGPILSLMGMCSRARPRKLPRPRPLRCCW